MTEFTRTQPAGRMIAHLFTRVGWAIVIAGLGLAGVAALLGRVPGFGEAEGDVPALWRLVVAMPGIALALFGLFSVMMAAQTRAVIDSADIAREMLVLARRRPISLLAAVPPLGEAAPEEQAAPDRRARREDFRRNGGDEESRAPVGPPRRVPVSAPRVAQPVEPSGGPPAETRDDSRAAPVLVATPRPKPGTGRVHPIFSARPPR